MEFGERIKDQRELMHLSQEEVAKRLRVSNKAISNWEDEKSYPDTSTLIDISNLYKIPYDEFLDNYPSLKESISKDKIRNNFLELNYGIYAIFLLALTISPMNNRFLFEILIVGILLLKIACDYFTKKTGLLKSSHDLSLVNRNSSLPIKIFFILGFTILLFLLVWGIYGIFTDEGNFNLILSGVFLEIMTLSIYIIDKFNIK